jgi:prevent-host-death family protein
MKTIRVAEAKTHFSMVLKDVEAGNEIAISDGEKREAIAVIIPYETWKRTKKRELGTLKGKAEKTLDMVIAHMLSYNIWIRSPCQIQRM